VIISRQIYQQNRPDVILMTITSQIRQPLTTGEGILQDWQAAGLAKPSVLKPFLATLEQTQIVKVMGRLSITDREALGKVLQTILGE
jgi:mRNA interferase MazF